MKDEQIGDVPRVYESLNDKPVVTRLPEVRAALTPLRRPVRALPQALQEDILNSTPPPQNIELLRIIHRTAELEPLANHPVVLDMWPLVDRKWIRN